MTIANVQALAVGSGGSVTMGAGFGSGNGVAVAALSYDFGNTVIGSNTPTVNGVSYGASAIKVVELCCPFTTGSGVVYFGWWFLPNISGGNVGQKTLGVTFTGGGTAFAVYGSEWSGLGPTPTVDRTLTNGNGNSLNPNVGPLAATRSPNELCLGGGIMLGVALAAPTGASWTSLAGPSNFGWAGYDLFTSSGQTPSWLQSSGGGGNAWSAVMGTLVPTATPGNVENLMLSMFP